MIESNPLPAGIIVTAQRLYLPAFCLRAYAADAVGWGQRFHWAATAQLIDDESLEVMGVCKPVDRVLSEAIKAAAAELGVYRVGRRKVTNDGREWINWHRTQ